VLLLAVVRGELPLLLDAVLDPQDDALEVDARDGPSEPHRSAGIGTADQRVALLAAQQGARSSSSAGGDQVHHTLRA
jgi:hypothetical protein